VVGRLAGGVNYQSNYDRIAQEHIAHWQKTGGNPFQDAAVVKTSEDATVALIEQYAPSGSMLDVGCGMGDLLARFPERKRAGCDISRDYLAIARERGLRVSHAYADNLPDFSASLDLVVCCDVLEHVLDLNAAVEEMLRVLKPDGVLIVRVPDSEDLSEYLNCPYEFVHLRRFDEPTLRLLFGKVFGCEVLDCPRVLSEIHAVVRK
jgi:ubiquinone/menaquinone biosynthesis C-methylase UbiE